MPKAEKQIPIKKSNKIFAFHYAVVFWFFHRGWACVSHRTLRSFLFFSIKKNSASLSSSCQDSQDSQGSLCIGMCLTFSLVKRNSFVRIDRLH